MIRRETVRYKTVVVTERGSSDSLRIEERDLRAPSSDEVRVKVLATPVCQDDIAARVGNRPFLPKTPFVPGYSFLGLVDAVGEGVTAVTVGDRVAALTTLGGHAEYAYCREEKLVRVPTTLDPAEAVVLILNYLVAYQALHRFAQVKPGDKVLIVGASGGVGTAFLQLGRLAGLKMYGIASASKHGTLTELGAVPIDYKTQDFVEVIRRAEPQGLDFVFNGMAEDYLGRGLSVLRRGGMLVHFGAPESFPGFLVFLAKYILYGLLPNGKAVKGYGTHRVGTDLMKEDWQALFKLLEEGRIRPIVAQRYPILEAAKANQLLESGRVVGNVVLVDSELP